MLGTVMLESAYQRNGTYNRSRVGTEVNASGELKESVHEGHAKGPRETMAIR